jgi:hypothetical protein
VSLRLPAPEPATGPRDEAPPPFASRRGWRHAVRPAAWPPRVVLLGILAGGLALRLYSNDHGLPYVYHPDEAFHFTSRAMYMFVNHSLDPVYLQNPSGFTELIYGVLRFQWGAGWPWHDYRDLVATYRDDPSAVYHTARVVSAIMCMLAVAAVYGAGRRLWGVAEGLAAAAVLSFAFLPVAYSRFAVTDVSALVWVTIAVYAIVRIRETDRLWAYAPAGAAAGVAVGFKYTAGVILGPLLVAAIPHVRRDRAALVRLAVALAAATFAFFLTTPYFFIHLHKALFQLKLENEAASSAKLGQGTGNPLVFYVSSLRWALGWGPALAVAAGIVVELRRDRPRGILLALMPILLIGYMSVGAGRWFARWLLPVYPVLALLAGVGFVWAGRTLFRGHPRLAAGAIAVIVAGSLVQPLVSDLHTGRVLGMRDTRQMLRDFLFATLPAKARLVVDPAIPRGFFNGHFAKGFGPPPKTPALQLGTPARYISVLSPGRIEQYRRAHHCIVVEMSLVRDRAFLQRVRRAMAYYRALPREGTVIFRASPYRAGTKPVPFDFDFSTHLYYPSAYERPGPDITVYRLNRCTEGYGLDAHTP